jgi:thioredoxin reductase (NADPH)
VTEALYLADICNKVYLVHRRDTFRAENIWIEKAKANEKIEFVTNEEVEEITGDALGMT